MSIIERNANANLTCESEISEITLIILSFFLQSIITVFNQMFLWRFNIHFPK